MEKICKYCGRTFKNKSALTQHEQTCKSNPNRIARTVRQKYDMMSDEELLTEVKKYSSRKDTPGQLISVCKERDIYSWTGQYSKYHKLSNDELIKELDKYKMKSQIPHGIKTELKIRNIKLPERFNINPQKHINKYTFISTDELITKISLYNDAYEVKENGLQDILNELKERNSLPKKYNQNLVYSKYHYWTTEALCKEIESYELLSECFKHNKGEIVNELRKRNALPKRFKTGRFRKEHFMSDEELLKITEPFSDKDDFKKNYKNADKILAELQKRKIMPNKFLKRIFRPEYNDMSKNDIIKLAKNEFKGITISEASIKNRALLNRIRSYGNEVFYRVFPNNNPRMFSEDKIKILACHNLEIYPSSIIAMLIEAKYFPCEFSKLIKFGANTPGRKQACKMLKDSWDIIEVEKIKNEKIKVEHDLFKIKSDEIIETDVYEKEKEYQFNLIHDYAKLLNETNSHILYLLDKDKEFLVKTIIDDLLALNHNNHKLYEEIRQKSTTDSLYEFEKYIYNEFLQKINTYISFKISKAYKAKYQPDAMQIQAFYDLKEYKYYANWCGTGAGKTNVPIIFSRENNLKLNIIICNNSNVTQFGQRINELYPDKLNNIIYLKNVKDIKKIDINKFNYVIINYEKFSFCNNAKNIVKELSKYEINLLCIDEIQFLKQGGKEESNRRKFIKTLRKSLDKNVYVYGMTATPLTNNLEEAISIAELITGKTYKINAVRNIRNCIMVHKLLKTIGFRYVPVFDIEIEEKTIQINGNDLSFVNNIYNASSFLEIESILLDKKLNSKDVLKEITPGTIIYVEYKIKLLKQLKEWLTKHKITFTTYTGDETTDERNTNKEKFINGEVDVIIGTSPISTGVDGLQEVSNKIIVFSYPWTATKWQQLLGRIYRRGSKFKKITVVHVQVYIDTIYGQWNYDQRRLNIIKNKQTFSEVVVDGKFDLVYELNKKEFLNDIKNDIKEAIILNTNVAEDSVETNELKITYTEKEYKHSESIIKDIHRKANTSTSEHMHDLFVKNPTDWIEYHKQREINKTKWAEDPVDVIAKELNERNDTNIIVDMGCGTAKLSKLIKEPNKVISIDHYSENPDVIQCDMKHTPIEDKDVDVTVFCLSLWGTNWKDYIKEAYRITAKRGFMYIVEPSHTFDEGEKFYNIKEEIKELGFDHKHGNEIIRNGFTYLTFVKN